MRQELNQLLQQKWEEWEIPRDAESLAHNPGPHGVVALTDGAGDRRRHRPPRRDRNSLRPALRGQEAIRVTGPLRSRASRPIGCSAPKKKRPESEKAAQEAATAGQFATMILDNLRKAGVQNTKRASA